MAGDAVISRNSLSDSLYDIYEKEANCFARSLLAPPNLISALSLSSHSDSENLFNLSSSAAQNVLKFIDKSSTMGIYYSSECELTINFAHVIWRVLHLKCCCICGYEYHNEYSYCPICGSTKSSYAGDEHMRYPEIEISSIGQVLECICCKNEEPKWGACRSRVCIILLA